MELVNQNTKTGSQARFHISNTSKSKVTAYMTAASFCQYCDRASWPCREKKIILDTRLDIYFDTRLDIYFDTRLDIYFDILDLIFILILDLIFIFIEKKYQVEYQV